MARAMPVDGKNDGAGLGYTDGNSDIVGRGDGLGDIVGYDVGGDEGVCDGANEVVGGMLEKIGLSNIGPVGNGVGCADELGILRIASNGVVLGSNGVVD